MEGMGGLYKKRGKEGSVLGFWVCSEMKVLLGMGD